MFSKAIYHIDTEAQYHFHCVSMLLLVPIKNSSEKNHSDQKNLNLSPYYIIWLDMFDDLHQIKYYGFMTHMKYLFLATYV